MGTMPDGHPRRLSLPRWPYLVVLAVAIAALVVRYAVLGGPAAGAPNPLPVLNGSTGQGTTFELVLDRNRVVSLRTRLSARCADGSLWRESWSPTNGVQVHVTTAGGSFLAVERGSPSYPGGIVGRIAFGLRGRITGRGSAQGTIRLVARFYRREQEWNACDSLDVAWAVGPRASARVRTIPLGRQVGSYYPAVPSLAVDVSPARQRFIDAVDAVCVDTYRLGEQAQQAANRLYRGYRDHQVRDDAYGLVLHDWQLRAVLALGAPPQARGLYEAWVANFRARLSVERTALALERSGQSDAARRELRLLVGLRDQGNLAGQQFGLVRCTSNGERTPIPILNDGQPPLLP
jgi:hypothetical protein